jgi:hypothetical protein
LMSLPTLFASGETRPVSGAKEILQQWCGCVKDLRRAIFVGGGIGADVAGRGVRAYYMEMGTSTLDDAW